MELPISRSTDDSTYSSNFPELEEDGRSGVEGRTGSRGQSEDHDSEYAEEAAEELGTDESIEDIIETMDFYLNKSSEQVPQGSSAYMHGLEKMLETSPQKAMSTIKRALIEKDSILKQQSLEVKSLHAEIQRKTEDARLATEIGQHLLAEKEKLARHNTQLQQQLQSANKPMTTGPTSPSESSSKGSFAIFQDTPGPASIAAQSKPTWAVSPISTAFRSPFSLLGFGSQPGSNTKDLAFSPSYVAGPIPATNASAKGRTRTVKENLSPNIGPGGKVSSDSILPPQLRSTVPSATTETTAIAELLRQELGPEYRDNPSLDVTRFIKKLEVERTMTAKLQNELEEVRKEKENLSKMTNTLYDARMSALPEVDQAVAAAQEAEELSQVLRVQVARLESALQAQMEINDQMRAAAKVRASRRRGSRGNRGGGSEDQTVTPAPTPAGPGSQLRQQLVSPVIGPGILNKSTVRFADISSPETEGHASTSVSDGKVKSLLKKKKTKSKGEAKEAVKPSASEEEMASEEEFEDIEEPEQDEDGDEHERQKVGKSGNNDANSSKTMTDDPETRFRGSSAPTPSTSTSASYSVSSGSPEEGDYKQRKTKGLEDSAPLVHQLVTPRPKPHIHKRVVEKYATLHNPRRTLPKTLLSQQGKQLSSSLKARLRGSSGVAGDWGVLMNALHMPYCKWRELPLFRELIWQGVPKGIRPLVWLSMAQDGSDSSVVSRNKYYSDLLRRSECDVQSDVQADISKDVHRTLPTQTYFQRPAGKAALRRVLTAFAAHNPDIGYCQGLNFLAGALLLIMKNEADTFWMLRHVVDPRTAYYTNSLCGLHVDLRVLEDLVTFYEPDIAKILVKKNIQLRNLCASWIMCIFMESPLPFECCARFWDVFLFYGDELVFYMVLAILQTQRSKIIAANSPEEVMEIFLHNIKTRFRAKPQESMDALMTEVKRVYMDQSQENTDTVIGLRQFHQGNVLTEHSVLSASMVQRLTKSNAFDDLELHKMWHMFLQDSWHILVTGAIDNVVDFLKAFTTSAFDELQLDSWQGRGLISGVFHRWFQVLDENGDGKVNFEEFISGVALFRKAGRNERLRAAFRFCDLNQQNCIGREELSRTLTMFEHLYNGHRKKCAETKVFCEMIFEKFAKGEEHIQWESFVRCALLHPLIVRFFRLQ
eukprot:gb/GEZN01000793.1/.p1 GENE.gb/GEZN01000793.1/~~gb/GEZN01000793.1/.p1  ORF type:complete len:1164 (+),score=208.04 gb/GEZN01000793.1/:123-3614(+)